MYELARRLQKSGQDVYVNAFNPGLMKTNFMPLIKASIAFVRLSMPHRLGDLEKSSAALAALVTAEGGARHRGSTTTGARGPALPRSCRTIRKTRPSCGQQAKNTLEFEAKAEKE
ncbi:MAG: hypothetical protein HDT38_02555 [Clostridiales bacterium]|nr:hypothetical protein [Clostridiales bacterium]